MKRTLIYLTTLFVAATATADVLSPAEALARLDGGSGARKISARVASDATPARTVALNGPAPEIYVFTPADGGMLLVSAESETPALIGYTDNYTPSQEMPPALEAMMRCWAAEIEAQRQGNVIKGNAREGDFAAIEPICKTRWNQDAPFYDQCPVYGGQRCYTGCVATAMAQVLKTYAYPAKCSGGTYSYLWEYGKQTLSINYDEITLDWSNMLDVYTSSATAEQKEAVATLMKAIGYGTQMQYSPAGSGAIGPTVATTLVRNFDYDTTINYCYRSWYSLSDWEKKVYDVLAEGHPVYYDGVTNDDKPMGHAFVVDGYRGDGFFHLNWGWGGLSDGYFRLTALDPDAQGIGGAYSSAGFDVEQGAIFGIKKGNSGATPSPRFYIEGGFKANAESVTLGGSCNFSVTGKYNFLINIGYASARNVCFAVKFTNADGKAYCFHSNSLYSEIRPFYGMETGRINFPATSLPAGTYTVTPAVYCTTTNSYSDVFYSLGMGGSFTATVANSTIEFSPAPTAVLSVTDVEAPAEITTGQAFSISGKLNNISDLSYYGTVTATLTYADGTESLAKLGSFMASVDARQSIDFNTSLTVKNYNIESGDYAIIFSDETGSTKLTAPLPVKLTAPADGAKVQASNLKCLNADKNDLKFQFTLKATSGNFKGKVALELHELGVSNEYVAKFYSDELTINQGASQTVTVSGTFADGITGEKYNMYVFYTYLGKSTEATKSPRPNFTLEDSSAIDEVNADNADIPAEYYDLAGRRVNNPAKGIYLMRRGTSVSKVAL